MCRTRYEYKPVNRPWYEYTSCTRYEQRCLTRYEYTCPTRYEYTCFTRVRRQPQPKSTVGMLPRLMLGFLLWSIELFNLLLLSLSNKGTIEEHRVTCCDVLCACVPIDSIFLLPDATSGSDAIERFTADIAPRSQPDRHSSSSSSHRKLCCQRSI